jgi:hypothetical protein
VLDVITFAVYALIIVEEGDEEGSGDGERRARRDRIESLSQLDRGSSSGVERGRWRREGRRVLAQAWVAVEDGEGDRVGGEQQSNPEEKHGQDKKAGKGDRGDGQWSGVLEISYLGDGADGEKPRCPPTHTRS